MNTTRFTLPAFLQHNDFAIYGFLNHFVLLKNPNDSVVEQIEKGDVSKTYEMPYGTRSKNIVNVHKIDAIGIHKPLDAELDCDMCILASKTCELLHVCNIPGRRHVSLSVETIKELSKIANQRQ
jgi:hypothetical protein